MTKDRHNRAVHAAGHAVIARKLGVAAPVAETASAAYLADNLDVAAQIAALENDAKISLAGRAANHREQPHNLGPRG